MYFWQVWNGLSLSNQATSGKGSKEYRGYCGILPKPGGVGCVHSWGWTGIGWKKGKSWRNFKFCRSLLSSIPIPVQPLTLHSRRWGWAGAMAREADADGTGQSGQQVQEEWAIGGHWAEGAGRKEEVINNQPGSCVLPACPPYINTILLALLFTTMQPYMLCYTSVPTYLLCSLWKYGWI